MSQWRKSTGWQAFETANKYYVIYMGGLWVVGALAMLFYTLFLDASPTTQNLIIGLTFLLAGLLVLFVGIKSKVSDLEES